MKFDFSFLTTLFPIIFLTYFPIVISTLAFALSALTMYLNRKRVSVQYGGPLEVLAENSLYCRDQDGVFIPGSSYGPGINLTVEIINSSPCELSYFDLRAFDPGTDKNYFLMTRTSLPETISRKKMYRENPENPQAPFHHNLPEASYGMLPGRSFTYWNLFIVPRKDSTKLRVSFRVAIKKRPFTKSDKYVSKNQKKYRFYAINLNIPDWQSKSRMGLPLNMPLDDFVGSITRGFTPRPDANLDKPSQEQPEK